MKYTKYVQKQYAHEKNVTVSHSRKLKASPAAADMVVLRRTSEDMSYLQKEHEEKMKLISLQQRAAESKRSAYDAKYEYYVEKRRKYVIDL